MLQAQSGTKERVISSFPLPLRPFDSTLRKMEASTSRDRIKEGDNVLVRLPSGTIKTVKIALKG